MGPPLARGPISLREGEKWVRPPLGALMVPFWRLSISPMPRARLDITAVRAARLPLDAPVLLRASAWESDVDLPEGPPDVPEIELIADGVALVTVHGPLSKEPDTLCGWFDGYQGEQGIAARFERAMAAPNVQAVLLHVESPGGTSAGLEDAVRQMVEARELAGKPVAAFVKEACSAAYWIAASVCDAGIFGGETAEAGSIGSYVTHWEESVALEQEGVKPTLIADPPGKVAGNPYEPLSELGRARIERNVKGCTARFFAAVDAARGLSEKELRALDGDVLEGLAAVDAGLMDGVADLETTVSLALAVAEQRARKAS
jgi:ClpP class serine protease